MHGSARLTLDVDVVYQRTADNLARLVTALAPYRPRLRGAPPGLPFQWDAGTLERGLNFALTTTLGPLEIVGGGSYEQLLPDTTAVTAFGVTCRWSPSTASYTSSDRPDASAISKRSPSSRRCARRAIPADHRRRETGRPGVT